MRVVIVFLFSFVSFIKIYAEDNDTLSFILNKRMSESDVEKKREGTFFTIIPDFSSDPVTGFGFGVRSNIFWNGERNDHLFSYTPYRMRLKINASYYTTNARELSLSLDIPYYKGTRWRYKLDFKAQQNPANLYFGLTESALGDLRLSSSLDGNHTYTSYEEFDKARKMIRAGGEDEADFVTDALSNRYRETEFMLNFKADYAIGDGRVHFIGGYEIQHLSYATFEGLHAEGTDPVTGLTTMIPNGKSLLRRDFEQQRIIGLQGGWLSILQSALIFDTRDFEPDPTKGVYIEIANEYSGIYTGSQFDFDKLLIQGRIFQQLPLGRRTVIAGRIGVGTIFGNNAPFFEFQDQWSPEGSINALGGRQSLRGYRANRFLARSMWFFNGELRVGLAEIVIARQLFACGVVPFFDAGTVRDHWQDLGFRNIKISYGCGARITWNQSTVLSFDYGLSSEDRLFFFGLGQTF